VKRLVDVLRQLPALVNRGAFDVVCRLLRDEVPIDQLGIARVAAGGDHLRLYVLWTSDEVGVPAVRWAERIEVTRERLELAYATDSHRLCNATGSSSLPAERALGAAGVHCTLSVPVGRPLDAIVGFGFRSPDRVHGAHLPLLRQIARLLHDQLDFALLEAHASRLRVMIESLPMGALLLNRDGAVEEVNAAAVRLVGCPARQLVGRSIRELVVAPDGGLLGWRIDRANGPAPALLQTANGARPVDVQLAGPTDREGLFGPLFVVDRVEGAARAELAALEEQHRALIDNLPVMVFAYDAGMRCQYVSAACERILGYTPAELYAFNGDWSRLSVDDPPADTDIPGDVERDFRQRRKDGKEITVRYRVRRIADKSGRVVRTEGFGIDVTAERETQRRLLLADRLAALGMLVAGIGHEINNPAAYVMLGAQQIGRHLLRAQQRPELGVTPLVEAVLPILDDVLTGIERISTIVSELKLFARSPATEKGPLDLNAMLRSAASLVQGELRPRARLTLELGKLPPVPGDWSHLSQVMLNLLVNAAQAIPAGNAAEHEVRVQSRFVDREVRVVVRDSGAGMDEETQRRIFTPFFTTKPVGSGSGLGLAISYDIARRLGGRITVASEPGRGSTFTVAVPYVSPRNAELDLGEEESAGSVLIVDDEMPLAAAVARELSRRMLVQEAHSGGDALVALAQARFDAVLCDVRMPDLSGIEVYTRTRARDAVQAARFVFMTGAGAAAGEAEFLREAGRPLLEKPFAMADLWRTVGAIVKARA
jgi:signal transduction histidine kinase/CheY-like chemotaxis protein